MRRWPVFFLDFLLAGPLRFFILAMDAPVWTVVTVFAMSGFGGGPSTRSEERSVMGRFHRWPEGGMAASNPFIRG